MKLLISGFEAFDGYPENPSAQVLELLHNSLHSLVLQTILLPVSFKNAFPILKNKIDEFSPDFVIALGLAGIRNEITPEFVAINYQEARIADNEGLQPRGQHIYPNAPDGLFSPLPLTSMIKACSVPCSISYSAGTYVCNDLMYKILYYGKEKSYCGGFIHIPPTPQICSQGTLSLDQISKGLSEMLLELSKLFANSSISSS